MRENPEYLALAWGAAVGTGLTPRWFFVGIEQVRLIAFIQLASRIVAAVLTFVLVKDSGDAWIVLGLFTAASVIGGLLVNALMYRGIPARPPRLRATIETLREGWTLFVGTGALALYSSANVVLLGLFASSAEVGHFGAAERVVSAAALLIGPAGPAALAVFPRLVYLHAADEPARARRLARISILLLGTLALGAGALLAAFAPTVVSIVFGPDFDESAPLLRMLAFVLPLAAMSAILGAGWMVALRLDRQMTSNVVTAGVLNVILALALTPLFGPVGMVCSVLLAHTAAVTGHIVSIRRHETAAADQVALLGWLPRLGRQASKTEGKAGG